MPRDRQRALLDRLFDRYVAPGGRLILGPFGEERAQREMEGQIRAWGHTPSGYCEKSHPTVGQLCKRMFWFDKE